MEPAVRAHEVSWSVDDVEILPPVSFETAPGSCTAVVGPNGSGKTTLLRIVSGRLDASSGSVRVFGRDADDRVDAFRRDVSDLVGAPATYDDLTVGDHLDFIGRLWKVEDPLAPLEALDAAGLVRRYVDELSSGQRQLAYLAMALARPARLLVLDEPEQHLDAERRGLVADLLRSRRSSGTAIVVATHDPIMRDRLADDTVSWAPTW